MNEEAMALERALPEWYVVAPGPDTAYAYPEDPAGQSLPIRDSGVGVEVHWVRGGLGGWYVSKSYVENGEVQTTRIGDYGDMIEAARAAATAARRHR